VILCPVGIADHYPSTAESTSPTWNCSACS